MRRAALTVLALIAASPAWAKPNMAKMPKVGPVKPYKAPPRLAWSLMNRVEVLLVEDHRFPLVTVRLAVKAGSAAAAAEDAGLADAMAALLTEGAGKRTAKEIADEADAIGGALEASADHDSVVVGGYALTEHAGELFALLSDVALRPDFPDAEVGLRKKNMLEELNVDRSQPSFLAAVALNKKLWPGHPYGITAPTEASIGRITRDRLSALHKRLFDPRRALLVIAGDVSAEKARALALSAVGDWKHDESSTAAPAPAVAPSTAAVRRVYLLDRPGSAQTVLALGNLALTEDHPDYFNLLLANQVLGGSFASRLMLDLREKKGYTYGIRSRLAAHLISGAFSVKTPVRTEVTADALRDIFAHLDRIRAEAVTDAELEQAKSFLAGNFTRGLETQQGVADNLLRTLLKGLPYDYLDAYVGKVQAVTREQALDAAKRYIRPESMAVVAVGDGAKIREALSKFSGLPVRVVDVNGD